MVELPFFCADNPSFDDINNFEQEMSVMRSAGKHPNIVSMIGYCYLETRSLLVVEYCCKGDLQTYLRTVWLIRNGNIYH